MTVDTLITEYKLRDDYSAKASGIAASTAKLGNVAAVAMAGFAALAGSVAGVGTALFQAGKEAAGFDSLRMALQAIEGDAAGANKQLKELQSLAKLPGLGFEEGVRAFIGLRQASISQSFAKDLIRQTANLNATSGGTKETFAQAMRAFQQIALKPFLQGEELLQLTEAGIPATRLVKEIFGTIDTEQLKRQGVTSIQVLTALTQSMAELPRVAGGAQNAFDNLEDAFKFAVVSVGEQVNRYLVPLLNDLGDAVGALTEKGTFAQVVQPFIELFKMDTMSVADGLLAVAAAVKTLGDYLNQMKSIWESMQNAPIVKWMRERTDFMNPVSQMQKLFEANQTLLKYTSVNKQTLDAAGVASPEPPASAPEPKAEMKEQTSYLRRTAEGIERQNEITRQAFGFTSSGTLSVAELQDRRVRGVKGRRTESALFKALSDYIGEMQAEFVLNNPPAQVFGR